MTTTGKTLAAWLSEAPFTLAMSSGYFAFFAHAGVLSVLEDAGHLPQATAGSSAGGLVATAWASGLSAKDLARVLFEVRRADFWDPAPGAGLLRGERFEATLERVLGARTFDACRVPARVSVFDLGSRTTRVASAGALARAVRATCTLPGLFQPTVLDGRRVMDGGILDRPGLAGVPAGERVLFHHIASRSPWRRGTSAALRMPRREGLVGLGILGLARSGPFALDRGPGIFEAARAAAREALARPVVDGAVWVG